MSGSSKRTFRMPRSFQPASTRSTETDLPSAITMASAPGSVVPKANLEPDLGGQRPGGADACVRDDDQHATFAPIAALERRDQCVRWLQVAALPPERRIRIVHHDQRAPWAANQHFELDEMSHVPIGFGFFNSAALQLSQQD